MKTGLLVIFLLGFGYLAPFSCGKKNTTQNKKQGINQVKPNSVESFVIPA